VANLQLAVKGEYFDAMIRGEKTEEYRLCNDYWNKRIMFREYDRLIITKGYPKRDDSSRRIDVPYGGYEVKTIAHPHFGDKPVKVYAGTGSINTSNEELKLRIEADEKTTESERLAALEIKKNIWRFKFKDAVKIKSDGARIHFGVGAQTVGNILRKYGLDPNNYAFWCYDEWDDIYAPEVLIRSVKNNETGEWYDEEYYTGRQVIIKPAGYQYGIRYEELMMFILMFI
jgi:hypothetical protein